MTKAPALAWLAVIAGFTAGCGSDIDPAAEDSPPSLRVEYAGCSGARPGPICLLEEGAQLTLWVHEARDGLVLEVDGEERPLPPALVVQGGFRFELAVTSDEQQVALRRRGDSSAWRLRLEATPSPAWYLEFIELAKAKRYEAAESSLLSTLDTGLSSGERGRALALLGQISFLAGEISEGQDLLRRSLPLLQQSGDLQQHFDSATVLVHSLLARDQGLEEARALLDGLPRNWGAPGEVAYYDAYYRGTLAVVTGDARGALERLEEAVDLAKRTGSVAYQQAAEEMVALQLQQIGRRKEAAASLEALVEQAVIEGYHCRQAGLLNNLGWNGLLSLEAGHATGDPLDPLHRALRILDTNCTEDLPKRRNVLLNIALAELLGGNPEAAESALAKASEVGGETGLQRLLWRREIEGRLALAQGRPREALQRYRDLRRLAEATLVPEAVWRAWVGQALSRWAAGDLEGARQDFQRSEAQLEKEILLVPMQEGRESFIAQRERVNSRYLALLLQMGRRDEALRQARLGRIRLLRGLNRSIRLQGLAQEQKLVWASFVADFQAERALMDGVAADDWRLPADALEGIRRERAGARRLLAKKLDTVLAFLEPENPGELADLELPGGAIALIFHPLEKGWVVFARHGGETEVVTPACGSQRGVELASCLLQPLKGKLAGASEIRILAAGELRGVDFQALPFGEGVLLEVAPIVYDLDLGAVVGKNLPTSAVVVADPAGNLPQARGEARNVGRLLEGRVAVRHFWGLKASREAIASALPEVELFHFAGHATFEGRGGWRTYLPLSEGGRLSLEDILLLQRVPRWVVLSGCETARSGSDEEVVESLGLAQAFLAAGTQAVLAAVRPVEDRVAAEMVEIFYPLWLEGMAGPAALRQAQLELRERRPRGDWSSFRWLER